MTELSLFGEPVLDVAECFAGRDVQSLKSVIFHGNLLNSVILNSKFNAGFPALCDLVDLTISSNDLMGIDFSFLLSFPKLKTLNFSGSRIERLSSFPLLERIEKLDISFNDITSLSGIEKFPGLLELDIRGNVIEAESFGLFSQMLRLEKLWILSEAGEKFASKHLLGGLELCRSLREVDGQRFQSWKSNAQVVLEQMLHVSYLDTPPHTASRPLPDPIIASPESPDLDESIVSTSTPRYDAVVRGFIRRNSKRVQTLEQPHPQPAVDVGEDKDRVESLDHSTLRFLPLKHIICQQYGMQKGNVRCLKQRAFYKLKICAVEGLRSEAAVELSSSMQMAVNERDDLLVQLSRLEEEVYQGHRHMAILQHEHSREIGSLTEEHEHQLHQLQINLDAVVESTGREIECLNDSLKEERQMRASSIAECKEVAGAAGDSVKTMSNALDKLQQELDVCGARLTREKERCASLSATLEQEIELKKELQLCLHENSITVGEAALVQEGKYHVLEEQLRHKESCHAVEAQRLKEANESLRRELEEVHRKTDITAREKDSIQADIVKKLEIDIATEKEKFVTLFLSMEKSKVAWSKDTQEQQDIASKATAEKEQLHTCIHRLKAKEAKNNASLRELCQLTTKLQSALKMCHRDSRKEKENKSSTDCQTSFDSCPHVDVGVNTHGAVMGIDDVEQVVNDFSLKLKVKDVILADQTAEIAALKKQMKTTNLEVVANRQKVEDLLVDNEGLLEDCHHLESQLLSSKDVELHLRNLLSALDA